MRLALSVFAGLIVLLLVVVFALLSGHAAADGFKSPHIGGTLEAGSPTARVSTSAGASDLEGWASFLRHVEKGGAAAPWGGRTAPTAASRSVSRPPWPSSASYLSGAQGVTPAATISAVPPSRPGTATVQTSPTEEATAITVAGTKPAARPAQDSVTPTAQPADRGRPTAAQWAKLRWCESRNHYDERANRLYRGAYQIGFREWAQYGGTGRDPADASPAEQDAVALRLWQARGWQPWAASSACTGLS